MVSNRMNKVDASGIRKVFDLAAKMTNPINLSIGQPDFDVPDPVKDAAIKAIQDGKNSYTQTQGIPELHAEFRSYYKKQYDLELDQTLVTSGTSGGLFLALMAIVNDGDEILVTDPYFVMYKSLVSVFGGNPVYLDTYPDFRLRKDVLEAALTSKTKAILLNSPANPTGYVYTTEELKMVADFASAHDLLVLSDEIYDKFAFDGSTDTIAKYYDKVIIFNGLSKSCAMTGWRVGFVSGPEEIVNAMTMMQQYSFVCAPSMAQYAGIAAMHYDSSALIQGYRTKRDIIYDGLKTEFNVVKPGGAFYIFPEAPGGNGMAFVERAIERNVLIIPGNVFSEQDTNFRISFATEDEILKKGAEVLCELAREFK
ncbi:pyridoxal phosphate-dependent aminotransferase [Candidatus Hydrogenedentota bacterium]